MNNYSELCNYIDTLSESERDELLHSTIEQINNLKMQAKKERKSSLAEENVDLKKLAILLVKSYYGPMYHQGCLALMCSNAHETYYWDSFHETVFDNLDLLSIEDGKKTPELFVGKKKLFDDNFIYTKVWNFGFGGNGLTGEHYFVIWDGGSNCNIENRYVFDDCELVKKRYNYCWYCGKKSLGHNINNSSADMTVERDMADPLKVKIRNEANWGDRRILVESDEGYISPDAWFDIDSSDSLVEARENSLNSFDSSYTFNSELGKQFPDLANAFNKKVYESGNHK